MKHQLLSFSLIVLICCNCYSQSIPNSTASRFSISLLGGVGIPVGDFSSFTPIPDTLQYNSYNMAGEAKTGWGGKLNVNYAFPNHFGIIVSASYHTFQTNGKDPDDLFENGFPYSEYTRENYEAENWKASGVQLGGTYDVYLNKFVIGFKLSAGTQSVHSPLTQLTLYNENSINAITTYEQPKMKSTAFVYSAGTSVNYSLNNQWSIIIAADYTGASHDFSKGDLKEVQTGIYGNRTYEYQPIEFSKDISFISITAGLKYRFSKDHNFKLLNETHQNQKLFQFSLAAGISIPVGDFSKFTPIPEEDKYYNFNTAGEPWLGYGANFGVRYVLTEKFGFAGSAYFNTFKADDKQSEGLYEQKTYYYPWLVKSYESGNWNTGGVLFGGYYEVPVKTAHFGFQLKGGLQYASCPQTNSLSLKFNNIDPMWSGDSLFYKVNQPAMSDMTFALNGGCYLRFAVNKKSSLTIESEYTTANHSFGPKDAEISTGGGWNGDTKETRAISFDKRISFISLMLRWGFYL